MDELTMPNATLAAQTARAGSYKIQDDKLTHSTDRNSR